ncbi:hypothetical protein DT065_17395 [Salicibibacter kimchii]|uniref:Uncharacterized protein n=1 Tax=Salicibibacter kimchii TaxID=2099786 RepID=A0A345C305_9BACI|nr:hypothetical protein DT065_17395 [Salicibibacter kimchii]
MLTGTVMVFGMGKTQFQLSCFGNCTHPYVRILDRFDIYGMILMSFGCYIRSALFFLLCYDQLISRFKAQNHWFRRGIFWGSGLLADGLSLFIANNHLRVEYFMMLYTNALIFLPIPFLLLVVSWFKRENNKGLSV